MMWSRHTCIYNIYSIFPNLCTVTSKVLASLYASNSSSVICIGLCYMVALGKYRFLWFSPLTDKKKLVNQLIGVCFQCK